MAERFGHVEFTEEEMGRAEALLARRIPKEHLATRQGPGGTRLTYIESYRAIELANEIFRFNGWSCAITQFRVDFCTESKGRWSCGVSSVVQVTLKDGSSHQDVGFGASDNQKSRGAAIDNAGKAAVSDARKRTLRVFGNGLGNCLYDAEYLKDLKSGKARPYRGDYTGPRVDTESNVVPPLENTDKSKENAPQQQQVAQPPIVQKPQPIPFQDIHALEDAFMDDDDFDTFVPAYKKANVSEGRN